MQSAVQRPWNYDVSFDFDQELIKRVSKNCESAMLKGALGYLGFIRYHSGDKFWGFSVDGTGFLYGTFAKTHFRLMELAVEKKNQGKGYGRLMLQILFDECIRRGVYSVTFRTSTSENAYSWYQKLGAVITGRIKDDYEMRFDI